MAYNILFVCTGNTCRSVMAKAIYNERCREEKIDSKAESAGIEVICQSPASKHAIDAMKRLGIDIGDHISSQIEYDDILGADVILTMTKYHKKYILENVRDAKGKVYTIYEYVKNIDKDVIDPYGKGLKEYIYVGEELKELIYKMNIKSEKKRRKNMIAIGSDHVGYELKKIIMNYFEKNNIIYKDYGSYDKVSKDYPLYAEKVAESILSKECEKGVLICGTGIGISIAANRIKGIRCGLCNDVYSAKATRDHNDANILALGARVIGDGLAIEILKAFLETEFSNEEKHIRRINLLDK